ncbi:MAG: hypothetical protein HOV83_24680 [Catenulispora sp.]|nr:hypothetical protein [Catenulispora sp.]
MGTGQPLDVGMSIDESLMRMSSVPDSGASTASVDLLSRTVRRQRIFLAVAVAAALAAGGGLAASTLIESPAQQAAETRPPTASVLTAPVARKVLANTVVVRGSVAAGGNITVTPQQAASSGSSGAASALVVSKLYARSGDQVSAGQVLIELSGRPIIALSGAVPAYRDLKPSMDGPDVAQLQKALADLGFGSGSDAKGHFGPGTKAAVSAFYAHIGYSVPTTGGPDDAGDRQALQSAADAVTTGQRAVEAAKRALDKADKALNDALAAARHPATGGTSAPPATTSPTAGQSSGDLQAARDARQQAQTTYDYAVQDLAKAQSAQRALIAGTGPMVPAAEVVFVPGFPVRLAQLNSALGQTVSGSLLTLEAGQLVVSSVLQAGQNDLVKPGMKVKLDAEALGDQTAEATVTSVGSYSTGQTGAPNTQGADSPSSAAKPDHDGAAPRQVQSEPGYPLVVTPDKPLPAAWAGQNVRVTIVGAATANPVLAVPLAAVSTGSDGQATVTVAAPDGSQHKVPVTPGISADGDVQVTPLTPAALAEGDSVVVGQAQQ